MKSVQPVLEVRDLSVRLPQGLDREFAVQDLSLSIAPREILCVVGESGSGKSITASVIMGLLPKGSLKVSSGTVLLESEDISEASEARMSALRGNRMAMIFQEPLTALNPVMKLGAQIAEVLQLHKPELGQTAIKSRVLELMADVHLPSPDDLYGRYPHQISGGQRQRVMIAMALAMEPALIIADEPTTALDVTTQAQILHLFRELLTKHNSAVLMITHDFGVVGDVADRVLVMRQGKAVETGPARQVLENPRHPYTKELISAVPHLKYLPPIEGTEETALRVENLSLTYRQSSWFGSKKEVKAVQEVSFSLAPGETLGIVGESGSGKSSLARTVVGFETPDQGRMIFRGHDLLSSSGETARLRHRIQMIFQDPYSSLNPRRRVGQSMIEGPVRFGKSKADALLRARELLERVGLPASALERFPHEFSGGQRQRICIARALALDPDIIVADEAVSALDVTVQAQVLDLFAELRSELGFAMLFITHDLRVASNICNRIAVMSRGRIVEQGELREVFENPAHDYTRTLLSAMPGASDAIGKRQLTAETN